MSTPITPDAIQEQLDAIKSQVGISSQRITQLTNKQKAEKDPGKKAAFTAQLKAEKTKLDLLNTKQLKLQNQYYEATGDYEKLLEGANRDAYLAVSTLFKSYGLESLAGKVYDYVKNGYSPDTISLLLQDSSEYKERFAGNELRKKAGLPVLSASEYLATEAAYRQVMESAGLPAGFYDSPRDFDNWIAKNISATEVETRVNLATQATTLSSPAYRKALNQIGISDDELTAYFLDPARALPMIQKSAATAAIGSAAIQQGLGFDTKYAEQLATQGVTAEQAKAGYSQIAAEAQTLNYLGSIYGEEYTQRTGEQAILEGNAAAINKRQRLTSNEKAAFSGSAGAARSGLAQAGGAR